MMQDLKSTVICATSSSSTVSAMMQLSRDLVYCSIKSKMLRSRVSVIQDSDVILQMSVHSVVVM